MSIKQVQIQNVFDLITKAHLQDGDSPLLDDIYKYLNKFFADQKIGMPYTLPRDIFRTEDKSDPELMNDFMALMITNSDTLYETCFNHIDQILTLNTVLRTHLDRLRIKRTVLNTKIDDYLLGIFNSDGYFYSVSDQFATTELTDFDYTTAFIDTNAGLVSIPAVSTKSRNVHPDALSASLFQAYDATGNMLNVTSKTQFQDALDGLTNTAWQLEVKTNAPSPIVLDVEIILSTALSDNLITKVDLVPFGVTPVQCAVKTSFEQNNAIAEMPFSSQVKTSSDKMVFIADQPRADVRKFKLQLKKEAPDYEISDTRERTKVYLFGFKEIALTEQYFDPEARFVSEPLFLDSEITGESAIDAVSITVDHAISAGTSISYYIAADNPNATDISGFNWKMIQPLTDSAQLPAQIVRFDGSTRNSKVIRSRPRNEDELNLFDLNSSNTNLAKRNPTPSYFNQIDVYRVARFTEDNILSTLAMEEGLNSTRVFYTDLSIDAYTDGFEFWKTKFNTPGSYVSTNGQIDTGHGFLYGADVGENGKSVYSESFVFSEKDQPVVLKECRKADANSKTWAVKVFLNGREIAALPVGTDKLTVPWRFRQGKNHVVVMANIPTTASNLSAPYIGFFQVMSEGNLFDYGVVKLDDWIYVDNYKFEYNITDDVKAFTIYNNEIVTRRKPTDNYRLVYQQAQAEAPEAVRVRADFQRSNSFAYTTPLLDAYRVRFSYGV